MLDALRINRAILVGASFGGWVSLQLATKAPERVRGLALFADHAGRRQGVVARARGLPRRGGGAAGGRRRRGRGGPGPAHVGARARRGRPGGGDDARRSFELQLGVEAQAREDPVDLGSIAVPTLVVSGGGPDFPDFARFADQIAARCAGAERAEVKDAGHLIALERPDATAAICSRPG